RTGESSVLPNGSRLSCGADPRRRRRDLRLTPRLARAQTQFLPRPDAVSFKRLLGSMPSRKPDFVSAHIVREARRHEHIAPVDLRDLHRPPELAQITITQLERGKSNPLEAPCVGLLAEGQVRSAPRDEEV